MLGKENVHLLADATKRLLKDSDFEVSTKTGCKYTFSFDEIFDRGVFQISEMEPLKSQSH